MRSFDWSHVERAREVCLGFHLKQLFLSDKVDIPVADLKKVFDVLDEDDDGAISIKEMVQSGTLEVEDALYLSELLDKGQDGEVSLQELMNLAIGTDGEVMESFKGLFAARLSTK